MSGRMSYILRDYQSDCVTRTVEFLLAQSRSKTPKNGLVYMPTGSGKALCIGSSAIELASRGGPTVIFQPTREILKQNLEKIESYGFRAGVLSASMDRREVADITLATIGSAFRHPEWFEDFQFGLIDECFVAGTLVDGRPIETIRAGDLVSAFDHKTRRRTTAPVLAVSKTPAPDELCCLRIQDAFTMSTLNHPYYVLARGYVAARDVKKGDIVLAQITANSQISKSATGTAMHVLRFTRGIEGPAPLVSMAKDWAYLSQGMCAQERCEECFSSNERAQPNGERCHAPQDGSNPQTHRAQAAYPGREWKAHAEAAMRGTGVSRGRLVPGIGGTYQIAQGEGHEAPDLLQNRYRESCFAGRCGNRRGESPRNEADARRKEDGILKFARVDSVEIFKQGSSGGSYDGRCYHYVYNLEVEGYSNYFANGVLVHNCHLVQPKDNSNLVRAGAEREFFHRDLGLVNAVLNQEGVSKGKVRVIDEEGTEHDIPLPKKSMYKSFIDALPHLRWAGFTGSPYRLESSAMGSQLKIITRTRPRLFDQFIHWTQNRELFDRGYLAKMEYFQIRGFKRSAVSLNSKGSDYDAQTLQLHLWERHWETKNQVSVHFPDKLTEIVSRLLDAGRRSVLVFTSSIRESEYLAEQMKGVCAVVTGDMSPSEREAAAVDFRSGAIPVVANVNCWTVGFDFPRLDTVVDAAPTMSLARYQQKYGRETRTHPDKQSAYAVDMVGGYDQFGPLEAMTLYCQGQSRWDVFGRPGGKEEKQLTSVYLGGNALKGCCPKCHAPKTVMYYTAKKKWLPVSRPPAGSRATLIVEYVNNKPHCRMVKRDDPEAHKASMCFHFSVCQIYERRRRKEQQQ